MVEDKWLVASGWWLGQRLAEHALHVLAGSAASRCPGSVILCFHAHASAARAVALGTFQFNKRLVRGEEQSGTIENLDLAGAAAFATSDRRELHGAVEVVNSHSFSIL